MVTALTLSLPKAKADIENMSHKRADSIALVFIINKVLAVLIRPDAQAVLYFAKIVKTERNTK